MTSKLTRERLQEIAEDGFLKHGESKELARMALAAMDSEPDCKERKLFCSTDTTRMRKTISVSAGTEDAPLYRHAQPAPVVPVVPDEIKHRIGGLDWGWEGEFNRGWNACRAAMLAAAPQSPGSEPATVPGKWIPVSERMPEVGDIVLTAMGGVVNVGETECSAANCRFFTSVISGRELPATHWMPLPAAPQEPSLACISKRSQHLS
ncbi:DUF551 domain-containing protein [Klebsiella pneumoniae]|uniref:DUF551 domain-containing protein n=1 Tax=Klebsiella pneumoniae TaxID=573 RepID=UPI0013D4866E|nr:DUF551 domain-containing protein [Klebsiella pneumoniae]MCK4157027.1 DUF551 domain-containing protein [Klebsiella pneumoniae]NGD52176.1 DUF551 domain-containing protein [Klebsiella pneumoniae]